MKLFRLLFLLAVVVAVVAFGTGCGGPEPVRIGYVAAITGRLSQLGIDGRNGVELAVQERNEEGGINGRPVEIIVRDDESDPEVGIAVLGELVRDVAVDAVIGPLTSNMLPAVQSVDDAGILVFSPIMSTARLSGMDDHFVRANLTITHQAGSLAERMIQDGINRTSIVFDVSNPSTQKS
jgi:branched-chain amino acid transport system substrate-binding protein